MVSALKPSGSQYGCRLICLTLVLVSIIGLRSQKSSTQVDAIISPKARICFNSMSTSFQSECVYCDSRLYTSTISACTGQPTLANNVTQAQAFCIATACLEVPVLNKAEPMMAAANQFLANYVSKLNLFRPSLMFGARNNLAAATSAFSAGSKYKKVLGYSSAKDEILVAAQQQSSKRFSNTLPYLRQEVVDTSTDYVPLDTKIGAPGTPSGRDESGSTTPKPPEIKVGDGSTTAAATAETQPAAPTEAEGTKLIEYPDFNKMHAKIYSNLIGQNSKRNKFFWRPFPYYSLMLNNNNNHQQRQQLISNQMFNLMHSFSSRLAEKRANWQTGKIPVVLGRRRKRSLLLPSLSFNLNKNKQKLQNNGTVTAQLNKLVNGTTSGNLAFVLNKPSAAYIWSNPLTKVFTKNSPNKSLQWQFGKGQTVAAAAAAPAAAGQLANPQAIRPAAAMATSGSSSPTARPGWNVAPVNSQNSNPPRASSAPMIASAPQQSNPTSASVMQPQIDTTGAGTGATGSFVVLADGRSVVVGPRQRQI